MAVTPACAVTPDVALFRGFHPWARLAVGAWRRERVVTESFDAVGQVVDTSTTETKTTLKEVGEGQLTLVVETTLEVAGKKLPADPVEVTQNFVGEIDAEVASVRDLGSQDLSINGKRYTCQVHEVELVAPHRRTVVRTWLSRRRRAPILLRRQGVTTQDTTGHTDETTSEVVEMKSRYSVLGRLRDTVMMNVERHHASGHSVMRTWQLDEVPGAVVGQVSEEFDIERHLVLRSKLELVGYGLN